MELNAWGAPRKMVVSDRSFGDYQTREEQHKLLQAYKKAGVKRFHYTNSGTLEYTHFKWFVSYYTFIVGYTTNDVTKDVYMHVNPFVFLKDEYRNSPTTTRQTNRWLEENGFEFTIQDIARLYDNAIHGIESYPMQRYVEGTAAVLVHPHFNHCQTYLNENGTRNHQRAIEKVPYLAYSEYQNSLVRVGWSIIDKNTFGVKYE